MNQLKFKACRINDTAYVELFEGSLCLAVIHTTKAKKKEDWNQLYADACVEAERLNRSLEQKAR